MREGHGRSGGFRSMGPREMHDAVCHKCGEQTQVPFKPAEGRPVFCKKCYMENKGM